MVARKPAALVSVTEKSGIVAFGHRLAALGFAIYSTGGTARELEGGGVPVTRVETIVGEELGGDLVKTLSREISAGLLLPDTEETHAELAKMNAPFIDLVCVDLYRLDEAIARGADAATVRKNTDVGGPNMLHAGAKGRRIVVSDPNDRDRVLDWIEAGKPDEHAFVTELCAKADWVAGRHLIASGQYHGGGRYISIIAELALTLRYGENAHQAPASLYGKHEALHPLSILNFAQIEGELPSSTNLTDIDRLRETIHRIALAFIENGRPVPFIAVGGKHGNLCGAAIEDSPVDAIKKMLDSDPVSIFGGTAMFNFPIGEDEARALREYKVEEGKRLIDNVAAPSVSAEAVAILKRYKGKCRVFVNKALEELESIELPTGVIVRDLLGALIVQPRNRFVFSVAHRDMQFDGSVTPGQVEDLLLAWAIGSSSNSNTITFVKNGQLIANAVGQQSRVTAAKLAVMLARQNGHDPKGATAYSDSYFPFPDGPRVLLRAGIAFIFASRGSKMDDVVRRTIVGGKRPRKHIAAFWTLPDAICRGFYGH